MNSASESPEYGAAMARFALCWARWLEHLDEVTRQTLDDTQPPENLDVRRRRWMEAVAGSLDALMRDPVFLDTLIRGQRADDSEPMRNWEPFLKLDSPALDNAAPVPRIRRARSCASSGTVVALRNSPDVRAII